VRTGALALSRLRKTEHDLIVADANLPDMSGRELIDTIRYSAQLAAVRVLIVTGDTDAGEMARTLERGADDYVTKPVMPEELVARVNAALRRPAALAPEGYIKIGPISLAKASHMELVGSEEIRLSPVEFRLMTFFMENPGRVHDRRELLEKVWRRRAGICERTVDVHVRRLRASLEPHKCEHMLKTVRGFGYRFG